MPLAPANGIEIFFDEFGHPNDPALLLVRGLGSQMIAWRESFCERIAVEGFRVVRFDNRDVGLSTKFDSAPQYGLDDMAADAIGLLDHLGIDAAHTVGMSLGGMIAQTMAIAYPERVMSLASVMSHMGGDDVARAAPEVLEILTRPAAPTREAAIEGAVADRRAIAGPGFAFDEDEAREIAELSYDRCYDPAGRTRQLAAVMAAPSRLVELSKLEMPVTVIHGDADPLIPVENGRRTAEAIPNAELVIVEGMGHDIPTGAWDVVIGAIVSNARRVRASA